MSDAAKDYIIKSGDDYLAWVENGHEPTGGAARLASLYENDHSSMKWNEVDGHRWRWSGMQSHATRFTWDEAREVVWRKLKTCTRDAFGDNRPLPIADRWAHRLVRLVPEGAPTYRR